MPERRPSTPQQTKPKQKLRVILLRLWKYMYRNKWLLLLALIMTVTGNLLSLAGPMLSGYAIDAIGVRQGGVDFQSVFRYCGLMLLLYVLSSALSYGLSVLMIHFSQRIIRRMRKDVFERLAELPVGFYDTRQTGDIISRISYDIDTVNASLSNDLLQICTSVVTVLGSFGMMLIISPPMTLVFCVTIPISIFLTKFMTGRAKPLFRKRSAMLGGLNGFVEEITAGQKTIRAYHQEETILGRFSEKNSEAVEAYCEAEYYGSMVGPVVNFVNNLSLSLVSVLGALLYISGYLTLGSVSSFVLYSRKFSGPINEMANILSELQSACAAAERVFDLLDEAPEPADIPGADVFSGVRGDVSIAHVSFGYTPEKTIIHDLSLEARPGSLVAIVGPTGAGKTTLINLLMRFYDPDAGIILLDGTNIRTATRRSLRQAYAMVLQDTWLFQGTIFENIAYGKKDASMEEVVEAAKAAEIHEMITKLPNGYHTVLHTEGMNISQGQKQLITIARAMLPDTRMLILDEATSNVDTRTEIRIQEAMRRLMRGKTCFVIAHRLSTIQNADVILVVKDGNIVEKGSHRELLMRGGAYAELYNAQFEGRENR